MVYVTEGGQLIGGATRAEMELYRDIRKATIKVVIRDTPHKEH